MKEIKTVITPLYKADEFDQQINNLIANGWKLTHRSITTIQDINEAYNIYNIPTLYAELERYNNNFEEITI